MTPKANATNVITVATNKSNDDTVEIVVSGNKSWQKYVLEYLPTERLPELTADEKEVAKFIIELCGNEVWVSLPYNHQLMIIRGFARKPKRIKVSADMTLEIVEFRAKYDADQLLYKTFENSERYWDNWPTKTAGTDMYGHPIFFDRLSDINIPELLKLEEDWFFQLRTQYLEETQAIMSETGASRGHRVAKLIYIIDIKSLSPGKHFVGKVRKMLQPIFKIGGDMYPDSLWTLWIVNAPMSFRFVWNVISTWLDSEVVSKIRICGGPSTYLPAMTNTGISLQAIPKSFGGELPDEDCESVESRLIKTRERLIREKQEKEQRVHEEEEEEEREKIEKNAEIMGKPRAGSYIDAYKAGVPMSTKQQAKGATKAWQKYLDEFLPAERSTEFTEEENEVIGKIVEEVGYENWEFIGKNLQLMVIRGLWRKPKRVKTMIQYTKDIVEFRKKYDADTILSQRIPDDGQYFDHWPTIMAGQDEFGHPIYCDKLLSINIKELLKLDDEKFFLLRTQYLEAISRIQAQISVKRGHRICKHIYIIDIKGLSPSKHFVGKVRNMLQPIIKIGGDMYPDCLWSLWIVNASFSFRLVWKVISTWVDQETRDKIRIVGSPSAYIPLMQSTGIPLSSIPESFGGEMPDADCIPVHDKVVEFTISPRHRGETRDSVRMPNHRGSYAGSVASMRMNPRTSINEVAEEIETGENKERTFNEGQGEVNEEQEGGFMFNFGDSNFLEGLSQNEVWARLNEKTSNFRSSQCVIQ